MSAKTKIYLKKFLNYAATVASCVFIIVLGITFFSRATTVTTTIGENISTNDLIIYGNATTTGAHYIGGNLSVNGSLGSSYFTASSTSYASTFPYASSTAATISNNFYLSSITPGSLLFAATSGLVSQNSSNLYWDNANNRLGIGTSSPYAMFSVAGQTVVEYFTATSTIATSTIAGNLTITKAPSTPHSFAVWDTNAANSAVLNSALLINPASVSAQDMNMIGVAVGGNVKFLVDSEGDVFVNSLTATGTVTQALTNISTLVVENNTTLGDAVSDAMTFKSGDIIYFNKATSTIVNNSVNAWSLATSTTITPTLTVSTASSPFGFIGIGTSSPYTTLSVNGETAANYFTAVSTTATSTFPYLASTQSNVGTVVGGTWQGNAIGDAYLTKSGDWTGTLDSIEGAGFLRSNVSDEFETGNTLTITGTLDSNGAVSFADTTVLWDGANTDFGFTGDWTVNTDDMIILKTSGNVGIGTTSPYAKLSVVGQTVAEYFTATSTTATSTFPYLTSTQSNVGTVVGGTWNGSVVDLAYGGTGALLSDPNADRILVWDDSAGANTWLSLDSTLSISSTPSLGIAADSLDFIDLQDTLDLDASLTLNQGTNTWTQNYTGTTGTGFSYNANSLTSGAGFAVNSSATGLTGNMGLFYLSGNNANNTGTVLRVVSSGANNTGEVLAVTNLGTGLSFRVNDETGPTDATPFVVDNAGNVGIGTTSPYAKLSVVGETVSTYFTATSTTATSTFPYLTSIQMAVTGLTAGSIPFIGTGGIISQNNSNLYWDNTNSRLGVSSSTPWAKLSVTNSGTGPSFIIEDQASPDASPFIIDASGNVGIGTSSPWTTLSVAGIGSFDDYIRASYFIATSTTATSTFGFNISGASGINTIISAQAGKSIILGPYGASVGVGTTTPWGKLSLTNTGTGPSFIIEDAASPDASPFIIDASGNVSIGTTTSISKLTVQGGGTGLNQTFAVFDSAAATSTFVVLDNGYVGVGTSTPWGRFSIEQGTSDNDVFVVADAGTSTPHMRIDGGGTTYIEKLKTGPMAFDTNAGTVSWIDMQVDATVATGTIESYTAMIDSNPVLTIFGQSGGGGVLATTSVGIGTTTPNSYLTVNASTTAPMAAFSVWNVNTAPEGPIASFWDGGTEVFKIDASGNIGIGTSTFASTLTIGTASAKVEIANGGLCVDSDGGCSASTTGRISAVSYVTAASDLAEEYYSSENLEAGDIVITKGNDFVGKANKEKQGSIIGIVSTKPGFILGFDNDAPADYFPFGAVGKQPIALVGRVPVKVNLEGGDIAIGDALAISSENGVAQKATEAGKIIGYALEEYNQSSITNHQSPKILVFLNITYWFPADSFSTADNADTADNSGGSNIISQSFEWVIDQFKNIGLTIADGIVSAKEFIAEKITAKKAAVDALEMKDAATGEIYCVKMENGEMNKVKGECQ